MKKLIIALAILLTACSQDFKKDIKPEEVSGVEFKIDSAKWTPALIQVENEQLIIYESNELRKVELYDPVGTWLVGGLFGMLLVLFIAVMVKVGE